MVNTSKFQAQANWVMDCCDDLGKVSQSPSYVDRRYLSEQHKQANELVAKWMQQANMHTWQDSVGNCWGRYESPNPNAKTLLFGSHLDTVINGGKYDGMLGVVAPIAVMQMLHDQSITLPFHVDIVGFCDEEGTRFGSTLLGSRALTGKWQPEWASLVDSDGISLRQAMLNFGLDFDNVGSSKIAGEDILAYIELHIEQGPVLETHNLPTGIVSGIAGAKRMVFNVGGVAGHSGTVPMNNRQDSLLGASEMIVAIENVAQQNNIVATVGNITNTPNAVNVISGNTQFSLDIRSISDSTRHACLNEIIILTQQIAAKRKLTLTTVQTHSAQAVKCDPSLIKRLIHASQTAKIAPRELVSGAGHDAMAMAEICTIGMLFTRCEKGISHHPKEAIHADDVEASLRVLYHFVDQFSAPLS